MTQVIKKNRRREAFAPWKIRRAIEYAALQADYPRERVDRLVDRVSNPIIVLAGTSAEVSTETLREAILRALEAVEPAVANEWRLYERVNKTLYGS